jgi:hypothetical protein
MKRVLYFCCSMVFLLRAEPSGLTKDWLEVLKRSDQVIAPEPAGYPVAVMYNREAVIPPQCYTKSEGRYNACYVCHQNEIDGRENVMNDGSLQENYAFSDLGHVNHWTNLQEDRREKMKRISDEEMRAYVAKENYQELPERLKAAHFQGWIPDMKDYHRAADAVDAHGHALDGSGWVAFQYKPFPSTFWPTNGSFDDVLIRLDSAFRRDSSGKENRAIYQANLALLECAIKGKKEMGLPALDENAIGTDLNDDGQMNVVHQIKKRSHYLGAAENQPVVDFLYPQGTEFMHGIRYLEEGRDGKLRPSARLKELRYMKKWQSYAKEWYHREYQEEHFAKEAGDLPGYASIGAHGLDNGTGWSVSGFIEDAQGRLRTLSFEENFSCMGCHNAVGSTIDKTFSFARKQDGAPGWGYIDLTKMVDAPSEGESEGEFLTYLQRVAGGSEFRNNEEMQQRWFDASGRVRKEAIQKLPHIAALIIPSVERAMQLNKAYRCIVMDQDYIFGKDATWFVPQNVYSVIDAEKAPTLPSEKCHTYSLLLDWTKSGSPTN